MAHTVEELHREVRQLRAELEALKDQRRLEEHPVRRLASNLPENQTFAGSWTASKPSGALRILCLAMSCSGSLVS